MVNYVCRKKRKNDNCVRSKPLTGSRCASAGSTAEHSCSILRIARRTSFATLAPRRAAQTKLCPARRRTPPRSRPGSPAQRPPTNPASPRRTPRTSGSGHIGRIPPPLVSAAEQSARAFRVPSIRNPICTVSPPRNPARTARPQSSASASHQRCQHESPARTAATRTTAQRMQRPRLARRRLSANARHDLDLAQFQFVRSS